MLSKSVSLGRPGLFNLKTKKTGFSEILDPGVSMPIAVKYIASDLARCIDPYTEDGHQIRCQGQDDPPVR
jgi:hypothetical protein